MFSGTTAWTAGIAVSVILAALFAIDLRVSGRSDQPISTAQATRWAIIWLVVGLAFAAAVWAASGGALASQYLGGYLVERILSVDNLAVLFVVLEGSGVPVAAQSRVLTWGLVGALGLRALLVVAGIALLDLVPGLAVILGAALIVTGIQLMRRQQLVSGHGPDRLARWIGRVVPSTEDFEGSSLVVKRQGRRVATPLVALIVAVMTADVVFALDSVPAVLSFSRVTWIVLAANGFALLGLRPLYFLVAGLIGRLRYLKHGLGVILGIAGLRLMADQFLTVPTSVELALVLGVLAIAVTASLFPASTRR